jgi:predicted DNA-binding transcriptional regulator YafY
VLRAGLVTAWCRMRQDERTFDLSRILWARPAGGPDAPAGQGPATDHPGGAPRG